MRKSPAQESGKGGRTSLPIMVFAEGAADLETARLQQADLLTWMSITSAAVAGEPREEALMPPGGFVAWGAKVADGYGAPGNIFPLVMAKMTTAGVIPLDAENVTSEYLKPIAAKNIKSFCGKIEPGARGLVVRGAKVGAIDNLYWLSNEFVSHWYGKDANRRSTLLYDVDHKGELDEKRRGPIDVLTVVALSPVRGEFVPVLCGGIDLEPPQSHTTTTVGGGGDIGGGGGTSILGDSNSGGGSSRLAFDPLSGTRIVPVYDASGRVVGTTFTGAGGGTGTTGGDTAPPEPRFDRRLRYTEDGPRGGVHVAQVGAAGWLVDGEACTLHRYATVTDTDSDGSGRAGAINTHHECSLHYEVGPNTGTLWKVKGDPVKDSPLRFDLSTHTAEPAPGRMIETWIRHRPTAESVHRGKKLPGLWRLETPCITPTVTPPYKPPITGEPPVQINCATSPLNMQFAAVSPLPHPNAFGSTALLAAQDCWPMDATAFDDENFARVCKTPWVGADYGWAEQEKDTGLFTQRNNAGLNPAIPARKAPSVGGFLRLPAGVTPDCRGDMTSYENPTTGAIYAREDIVHYSVADGYGRIDPVSTATVTAGVRDGFRRSMVKTAAAARVQLWEAIDTDGAKGASATGLYTVETQTLQSCGGPITKQLSGDAFTPGNGVDHDLLCETGITDNLATITATNVRPGTILRLRAAVGTITAVESDNVRVVGATRALAGLSTLTVRYDGSLWVEIAYAGH